jgi:uncharacterized protein (TIGR02646 family)
MRKIEKSQNVPATLVNAPIPANANDVKDYIYKAPDVRKQLMQDQHHKCAYCECYLPLQYNDVEHFRPKSHYYWLGHEWKNLLYSCARCNRSYKKTKFPLAIGSLQANSPTDDITLGHPLLINPTEVDPSNHIKFNGHVAVGITLEGKTTIDVFHLNDWNQCPELIDNRRQLFELYKTELDKIKLFELFLQDPNLSQSNRALATNGILLCNQSIEELTSLDKQFSGMLVSQL